MRPAPRQPLTSGPIVNRPRDPVMPVGPVVNRPVLGGPRVPVGPVVNRPIAMMKKGGSASSRADGCAKRGKTKGKII
jgi:hypothetical protein